MAQSNRRAAIGWNCLEASGVPKAMTLPKHHVWQSFMFHLLKGLQTDSGLGFQRLEAFGPSLFWRVLPRPALGDGNAEEYLR